LQEYAKDFEGVNLVQEEIKNPQSSITLKRFLNKNSLDDSEYAEPVEGFKV